MFFLRVLYILSAVFGAMGGKKSLVVFAMGGD
jgi:hypothetical protein